MSMGNSDTVHRVKKSQPGAMIAGGSIALTGMLSEFIVQIARGKGLELWGPDLDLKAVVLLTAGIEWIRRTIAHYKGWKPQ